MHNEDNGNRVSTFSRMSRSAGRTDRSSNPFWEFVMIKGSKRALSSVFVIKQLCLSLATSTAAMIIGITSIGLFDVVESTGTRCFCILVPHIPSCII